MSDNESKTNMGIIPMFALPLFVFPIENWSKHRKSILNLLPKIEPLNGISTDRTARGLKKELPHYKDVVLGIVEEQLEEFSKVVWQSKGVAEVKETQLGITEMWYRTDTAEAQYTLDNEGTIGWTAILYVDFDREIHYPTHFVSPMPRPDDGTIDKYEFPCDEGMLVIFPSSLPHMPGGMDPEENIRRTIVSFNIKTTPTDVLDTIIFDIEEDNNDTE